MYPGYQDLIGHIIITASPWYILTWIALFTMLKFLNQSVCFDEKQSSKTRSDLSKKCKIPQNEIQNSVWRPIMWRANLTILRILMIRKIWAIFFIFSWFCFRVLLHCKKKERKKKVKSIFLKSLKRYKIKYLKIPPTVTLSKRIELLKFLNQSVCFDKNKQTDKQDLLWLVRQIVKFREPWNLEIVVGSGEYPILPAFQSQRKNFKASNVTS